MKHITVIGEWLFEIKEVRAIRVKEYGRPYDAIANVKIVDGEARIEGVLSQDLWTKEDTLTIEDYLRLCEFDSYVYSRFKQGRRVFTKKELT